MGIVMYGFAPFPPPPKHARFWKLYLLGSIAVDLGLLLALILYGGFALLTVSEEGFEYLKAVGSQKWSSVEGKIISSGTIPEGRRLGVVANYTYRVDDIDHTGYRLVFSTRRPVFETEAEADHLLMPFGRLHAENEFSPIFEGIVPKVDRRVAVYYEPAAPDNSTLRREYFANPDLGTLWPAVPLSAFLLAILLWSFRSWRRYISSRGYESVGKSRLPK